MGHLKALYTFCVCFGECLGGFRLIHGSSFYLSHLLLKYQLRETGSFGPLRCCKYLNGARSQVLYSIR